MAASLHLTLATVAVLSTFCFNSAGGGITSTPALHFSYSPTFPIPSETIAAGTGEDLSTFNFNSTGGDITSPDLHFTYSPTFPIPSETIAAGTGEVLSTLNFNSTRRDLVFVDGVEENVLSLSVQSPAYVIWLSRIMKITHMFAVGDVSMFSGSKSFPGIAVVVVLICAISVANAIQSLLRLPGWGGARPPRPIPDASGIWQAWPIVGGAMPAPPAQPLPGAIDVPPRDLRALEQLPAQPANQGERQYYRLIIVGDLGTGKSSFASRNLDFSNFGNFPRFTMRDVEFSTNIGQISVTCFDCVGGDRTRFRDVFSLADCAIIMFDVTNMESLRNHERWRNAISRRVGGHNVRFVLVGNKADLINERTVTPRMVARRSRMQYYEISALCNYNYELPFLYLLRELKHNPGLQFVTAPRLAPPEVGVFVDAGAQAQNAEDYADEVASVAAME